MKKIGIATVVILLLLLLAKALIIRSASTQKSTSTVLIEKYTTESVTKTEIIEYKQTYIPEEKRTGSCWTTSIAASMNETAYRCMVGEHQIIDPCFETENGRVVCGVDPEQSGSGFELQLTKKLPEQVNVVDTESGLPWRLKLKDGRLCGIFTGTAAIIGGKVYYIYCGNDKDDNSAVGELDKSRDAWRINLIYSKDEQQDFTTETVDVIKVWK